MVNPVGWKIGSDGGDDGGGGGRGSTHPGFANMVLQPRARRTLTITSEPVPLKSPVLLALTASKGLLPFISGSMAAILGLSRG